jgi:SnoaL-like domain
MNAALLWQTEIVEAKEPSMSEVSVRTLSPERVLSAVLSQLNHGQIGQVVDCFAADFRFKDNGIGLEFSDKERLAEFFQKTRQLYPDYSLQSGQLFVSGDHVITQWTLHVTVTEPFYWWTHQEHTHFDTWGFDCTY